MQKDKVRPGFEPRFPEAPLIRLESSESEVITNYTIQPNAKRAVVRCTSEKVYIKFSGYNRQESV